MNRHQRVIHVATLVVISVCGLASPSLAEDCPELLSRLPAGPIFAVAASGDYAYLGGDSELFIADVSDPSAPHVVGELEVLSTLRTGAIAVSGGYAYVADDEAGLRVVDVSTPSAPFEVALVDTQGLASGVAVSGGHAYVADSWAGLRVIDVSTPSAPVEVGALVRTSRSARRVAVSGGYAYVLWSVGPSDDGGLSVIDVSTPSEPVEVGFLDVPDPARDVAVSGGYAYAAEFHGLRVIDVSTPSEPVEVAFVDTLRDAQGVAVSGGHAYVARNADPGQGGLCVIDVSTPAAPVEVACLNMPDSALGVAMSGDHAYVADLYAGLRVIDVSTPSAPVEVGVYDTPDLASDVAVSGAHAYVAGRDGLQVIDVSTPAMPIEVGFVNTLRDARGVVVSGGYAHVAWNAGPGQGGLSVIDVRTPSEPVEVGFVDTQGEALGVAVSGGYAYVVGSDFWVIDVSTPSEPVVVGFVDTQGGPSGGVAAAGGYAYVAASSDDSVALLVFDVSTPSAPAVVGAVSWGNPHAWGQGRGVAISGSYAYVASGVFGLRVIDVGTPAAPVEVAAVETRSAADVAVSGDYAYVAAYESLQVIDRSTPSAPFEVGSSVLPRVVQGVAIADGHVFAAGYAGLYVFNECERGTFPDGRECFIPAAAVAAGAQGAFFQTDVEVNNAGTVEAQLTLQWLPRGEDNSEPIESDPIALAPGEGLRWENVLTQLFGLGSDSVGALKLVASRPSVIGMSRTYNSPEGKAAGTFGQGLPAIRTTEMISGTEAQRIIFLSENEDSRANVGCVNGSNDPLRINIGLFDAEGTFLETKTMDLGPYSNNQINRVFRDYQPVNGYVDVSADSDDALYYCYGSVLDNLTSDPTTILPQVPSSDTTFIPAAALAAGLEGSFFRTDIDLNNVGSTDLTYELLWLPRGTDNTDAVHSDTFSLAPGAGVRYANVLDEVFGLDPDQVGALAIEASGSELLAMSRTYNLPSAKVAGTFGQELPGIPADRMIPTGEKKRIIFMSENDDVRANVGCVNGVGTDVAVQIELYDSDGAKLETKYMMLPPYSNRQINGIFQNYAPVNGYVDVRTYTPDALIYCYGSVLDNVTSDPTTVLPQ
jgi:hypothetical protein